MSIIHQALKKVQQQRGGGIPVLGSWEASHVKVNRVALLKGLSISLAIILGILIFLLLWGLTPPRGKGLSTSKKEVSPLISVKVNDITAIEKARGHNKRGVELYMKGRFIEAAHEFDEAIKLYPNYAEAYNNLGLVSRKMGDNKKAKSNYEKALGYRPDYSEALNNYGILLEDLGKREEAMEYFKKASQIAPLYPAPYLNMAISLEKGGRVEEAVWYYRRFLSLPEGSEDPELIKKVKEKILYLTTGSLDKIPSHPLKGEG
ncbi:MAG: tetratricopeptide repeat protein [Deltaproteobacteria bacterium]|nr:tetratricopeptide repeat protein [Deltaproteobacteria bacterium]